MNRTGSGSFNNHSDAYDGIQVLSCVQGNTARRARYDLWEYTEDHNTFDLSRAGSDKCEVYDFRNRRTQKSRREASSPVRRSSSVSERRSAAGSSRRSRKKDSAVRVSNKKTANKRSLKNRERKKIERKKIERKKIERKIRNLKYAFLGVMIAVLITVFTGIGSKAGSREIPKAYKYYDTITVGCYENLLDIVERYDNRDYYETQTDYVKELCRINNIEYNPSEYPDVPPGTHLVVPYYSEELK